MRTGIQNLNVEEIRENLDRVVDEGEDSVRRALVYLTSSNAKNFYARVLSALDRYSVPGFGTMGVTVKNGRYVMVYDPFFAARVGFEELAATCEHEVLHIILEHIPRSMRYATVFEKEEDRQIFFMVNNLAVDAAANELLARNWPGMRDKDEPLGYWVLPDGFKPALPKDMSYEVYQELLVSTVKQRLKTPADQLYQLAKQILQKQQDTIKQALGGQNPSQGQQGQGQQGQGQQGQGQQGQQPGQGGGQGGNNNQPPQPSQDLQNKVDDLDPVDREILKMLMSSMVSHGGWQMEEKKENAEAESHQLAEHGKEVIKQTYDNHSKSRGTIPAFVEQLIREMLQPPTVPWEQFLRNIVQRTRQTKKERGMSRPSKMLSAMHFYAKRLIENGADNEIAIQLQRRSQQMMRMPVFPGIKHSNKYTILYIIDTSGSMGIKELQSGLSELQHIQKSDSDVSICVIYSDTYVCKEYWIGPSTPIDPNLVGRGGTDFDPAFRRAQELLKSSDKAPDIVVYATDGYAPPPTIRLPIPVVWLITPRGRPCCDEAGHITIEMRDYKLGESAL